MKNKIKAIIKIALILIFVLLSCLFVSYKLSNKVSFAALSSITEKSKERPVGVKEWTSKVNTEGRKLVRNFTGKTLDEILPKRQKVEGEENTYYITKEDLRTQPSLFCSARGTMIPGYGDVLVLGSVLTDQGKRTYLLTPDDIEKTTVLKGMRLKYKDKIDVKGMAEEYLSGFLNVSVGATKSAEVKDFKADGARLLSDSPTLIMEIDGPVSVSEDDDYIYVEFKAHRYVNGVNSWVNGRNIKVSVDGGPFEECGAEDLGEYTYEEKDMSKKGFPTVTRHATRGETTGTFKIKKEEFEGRKTFSIIVKWNFDYELKHYSQSLEGNLTYNATIEVTYDGKKPADDSKDSEQKDEEKEENPGEDKLDNNAVKVIAPSGTENKDKEVIIGIEIDPSDGYKVKNVRVIEDEKEQKLDVPEDGGKDNYSFKKDTETPGEKNETRTIKVVYDVTTDDESKEWKDEEQVFEVTLDYYVPDNTKAEDETEEEEDKKPSLDEREELELDEVARKVAEDIEKYGYKSYTYGKYKLAETRDATPAEAWVLAEADNNKMPEPLPNFTVTDQVYEGPLLTDFFPYSKKVDARVSFVRYINEIIEYVQENDYKIGDAKFWEYDKKEINSSSLIEWGLLKMGVALSKEALPEDYELPKLSGLFEDLMNDLKDQEKYSLDPLDEDSGLKTGDIFLSPGSFHPRVFIGEGKAIAIDNEEMLKGPQPVEVSTAFVMFGLRFKGKFEEIPNPTTRYNANIVKTDDGRTIYIIGKPGEEKFVTEKDNKLYYVTCSDPYFPSNYVENGWWKVKKVGTDTITSMVKDTDLGREAEAFEQYIKKVTGQEDVGKLERNEDGSFKIDYKVSMEPTDTSLVKTRFNSVTNKYIVGPFKVDYLRAVTKQGNRDKVSFSGISNSILVGTDAQGNELLDEEGNSVLKLGKNYRFVYSNSTDESTNYGHDSTRNVFDTDEDYPYPSSGEEFYIEIDYLDDLCEISSFKFDFQYMTANGKYEYYTGNHYEIEWENGKQVSMLKYLKPMTELSGLKGSMLGGQSYSTKLPTEPFVEQAVEYIPKIENLGGDFNFLNASFDDDKITFSLEIKLDGDEAEFYFDDLDISGNGEVSWRKVDDKHLDITINKNKTRSSWQRDFKISYKVKEKTGFIFKSYNVEERTRDFQVNYYNRILEEESILSANKRIGVSADGGDYPGSSSIYVAGIVPEDGVEFKIDTKTKNGSTQNVYYFLDNYTENEIVQDIPLYIFEDSNYNNETTATFKMKPGEEWIVRPTLMGLIVSGLIDEQREAFIYFGEFAIGDNYSDYCKCAAGENVVFWNASKSVTITRQNYTDETSPVNVELDTDTGKIITSLVERNTHKDKNDPVKFVLKDGDGNEVILEVTWENKGEEPGPGEKPEPSGSPSASPSGSPSTSSSGSPSGSPSTSPSGKPSTSPSGSPSTSPSGKPSTSPSGSPSTSPSGKPSTSPSGSPSTSPSVKPSTSPSGSPSTSPSGKPSTSPSGSPSASPSGSPSTSPSGSPSTSPSGSPSTTPSTSPSPGPGDPEEPEEPVTPSLPTEIKYDFYLVIKNMVLKESQGLINAVGDHSIFDIDANIGLGDTPSGSPVEIEMLSKNINLRTSMSGFVWIDDDESGEGLGVYNKPEKTAQEGTVEIVVWKVKYEKTGEDSESVTELERTKAIGWDENGNAIDFENNRLYIDANGTYKIPEIQVPSVEGNDGTKIFYAYDVEFIYDGQNYEATEFLKSTGKDTLEEKLEEFQKTAEETKGAEKDYDKYAYNSYAIENKNERADFDKKFTEIYGGNPIDDNMKTKGYATDGSETLDLLYDGQLDGKVEGHSVESILDTLDDNNHVFEKYRLSARVSEAGLLLPYDYWYHPEKEFFDNLPFQNKEYKPINEYFTQINLGLLERKVADINVSKDVYKTKLIVNDVDTDITFNKQGDLLRKMLILQKEVDKQSTSYRIDLYNSDYYYRSQIYNNIEDQASKEIVSAIKTGTELRAFVTYRIAIFNGAKYSNLSVNELKDYHDDTLSLVTEPVYVQARETTKRDTEDNQEAYFGELTKILAAEKPHYRKLAHSDNYNDLYRWSWEDDSKSGVIVDERVGDIEFEEDSEGNGYKVIKTSTLKAINDDYKTMNDELTLKPGEAYEIFLTYEVDKETYDSIQKIKDFTEAQNVERTKLVGSKNNIAEISRYSTQYIDKTRTCTSAYDPETISGGIDTDSAPDNLDINKIGYQEVDGTDKEEIVSALDNSIETNKEKAKQAMPEFFEDDTGISPVLKFNVRNTDSSRKITGLVWDDGESSESDSIYSGDEKGIKGVEVSAVEKIRVKAQDLKELAEILDDNSISGVLEKYNVGNLDYEFDYIWPENSFKTTSKHESKVSTGEEGTYELKNYIAGNFVVKFEYGNNEECLKYNGQDYKNVSYQRVSNNAIKNPSEYSIYYLYGTADEPGCATLNNEWHNLKDVRINGKARYSDARDYEPRRLQVIAYSKIMANNNVEVLSAYANEKQVDKLTDEYKEELKKNTEKLIDATAMQANTAKLDIEIENPRNVKFDKVKTISGTIGTSAVKNYSIDGLDFGLTRRPETKINIQNEINEIVLYKDDVSSPVLRVVMDDQGDLVKSWQDLEKSHEKTEKDDKAEEAEPKESKNPAEETIDMLNNNALNPDTSELDTLKKLDVSHLRKVTEINKKNLVTGSQGFKYVAVEPSYLVGMNIRLKYKTRIFNNSDVDYTSYSLKKMETPEEVYESALNLEESDEYISGKKIRYGKVVGLYYYTGEIAQEEKAESESTNEETLLTSSEDVKVGNIKKEQQDLYNYDKYEPDFVVSTKVHQIVDYVDTGASRVVDEYVGKTTNMSWINSSDKDLEHKISKLAFLKEEEGYKKTKDKLLDNMNRNIIHEGRNNLQVSINDYLEDDVKSIDAKHLGKGKSGAFYTEVKNEKQNLIKKVTADKKYELYTLIDKELRKDIKQSAYNPDLIVDLIPIKANESKNLEESMATIFITEEIDATPLNIGDMRYNNLAEILVYGNSVGRRDMETVPGNANILAKDLPVYKVGYNVYVDSELDGGIAENTFARLAEDYTLETVIELKGNKNTYKVAMERDQYASRDTITFSEPTGVGISRMIIRNIITLLEIVIMVGIIVICLVVTRRKLIRKADK